MNNISNIVTIENGGGNSEDIYRILDYMFKWSQWHEFAEDRTRYTNCRDLTWQALSEEYLYTEKFYDHKGTKIVKHIKKFVLESGMKKEEVAAVWPQIVAAIGELYVQIEARTEMKPDYFNSEKFGLFGDDDSCFQEGGCNHYNGRFIDDSPACGTILIRPTLPADITESQKRGRYGKGRMICYIQDQHTAYLMNNYTQCSRREIPRSIFVRALESLSGATIEYTRINRDREVLPIFPNHSPYKCTAIKGNFDLLTTDYRWSCPSCSKTFDPSTVHSEVDGNTYMIGCSNSCMWEQAEGDRLQCSSCGNGMNEDDSYWIDGDVYCEYCYNQYFFYCECCDHDSPQDNSDEVEGFGTMCETCIESTTIQCTECGLLIYERATDCYVEDDDANPYCNRCGVPEKEEEETG
jgi:hypothetical protein